MPQFEKDFKELVAKYPSHSIIVAGHSFGGGLATVMGYMIAKGKLGPDVTPSKTELITLGSSRAGNRAFANVINKAGFRDTSRLVHSTDAVAHMPWATGTDRKLIFTGLDQSFSNSMN